MKRALLVCGLSAVIASSLMLIPSPSSAKTVKACVEEWKVNKSTIQASGKTRKDFITECRAETTSTEPTPTPTPQPTQAEKRESTATAAPETTAAAKHKTIKACAAEWTENKATIQASGKTRKDFITECRTGTETVAASTAPSANVTPSTSPTAGHKTARACEEEWRANKSTIQASGKKKTDFVTECRAETASIEPAPAPTAQSAPAEQPTATAPRARTAKTLRACAAEWTANKATLQASGTKRKDFITDCHAGVTSAAAAPAPTPQAAPAEQPKPAVTAAPKETPAEQPKSEATAAPRRATTERKSEASAPPPAASTTPTAAGEFRTEAEAKTHCPDDTVVWANTRSKIYHYASSRRYGHTKSGAYMCEKETTTAGIRAAKREKRT